jgi:hypothetical protein
MFTSEIGHHMSANALNWTSFWDLASPAEGARALIELYGPAATEAAARCAVAAHDDGREGDCRFWLAVSAELKGAAAPITDCRAAIDPR